MTYRATERSFSSNPNSDFISRHRPLLLYIRFIWNYLLSLAECVEENINHISGDLRKILSGISGSRRHHWSHMASLQVILGSNPNRANWFSWKGNALRFCESMNTWRTKDHERWAEMVWIGCHLTLSYCASQSIFHLTKIIGSRSNFIN